MLFQGCLPCRGVEQTRSCNAGLQGQIRCTTTQLQHLQQQPSRVDNATHDRARDSIARNHIPQLPLSECSSSASAASSTVRSPLPKRRRNLSRQVADPRSLRPPPQRHSNPIRRPLSRAQYAFPPTPLPLTRSTLTPKPINSWLGKRAIRPRLRRSPGHDERQSEAGEPDLGGADGDARYVGKTHLPRWRKTAGMNGWGLTRPAVPLIIINAVVITYELILG